MKTLMAGIVLSLLAFRVESQIDLFNSVTREKITIEEGALVSISAKVGFFYNFWDKFLPPNGPHEIKGNRGLTETTFSSPYDGETLYFYDRIGIVSYTCTVSAPGYESYTLSKTNANWPLGPFTTRYIGAWNEHITGKDVLQELKVNIGPVYLVPKKDIIEGDIRISGNASDDLGFLTTIRIAKALGISESEVIDLILNEELKAKKIGDKYFVRNEDFDAFMRDQ